ncbi:MAG: SH3 domain-containing protein [Anaerolineae bacterium]|nr:SH3 domain-containing protein [Candidatus Roseilinea sp.]MDW8448727.1 SH3 domain-containing protein [Anaerolineae bacterium]
MKKFSARPPLIGLVTIAMILLAACGSPAPPPTASITSPTQNAQFQAGDEVKIEGKVTGSTVKQVDVFINNERYATVDQAVRPNEFEVSVTWIAPAEITGASVIQLKGINDKGEPVIASDAIFITIQAPQPTATPTAAPTPIPTVAPSITETPTAAPITDTAAITGTGATTPTTSGVLLSPRAENDYVNVRELPDLTARLLGQINKGQSVPVRGRNADGTWYQINFPAGPDGAGWVYALVASVTGVTTTLPVVTPSAAISPAATVPTNPAGLKPPFIKLKAGQDFANVRTGPDTAYQKVGELRATGVNAAAVKGKSANGQWWQIEFAGAPGGTAWVFRQLVDLTGDDAAIPVAAAPPLPTAAPTATPAPSAPQPTPTPSIPASAVLPYSQNVRFSPRDDIGDVPLGYQGQPKTATLEWQINGATKAELEITTRQGPGIFENCPPGNLASITPNDAVGKRMPLQLPSGTFQFTIPDKGYYLFTIYVVKSDGTTTDIPRNVIVDCFKTQ